MTPEARWKRRVEMFESLNFHDFFSGPGPMRVDGRDGESEQMINPPDAPLVRVLAEAVKVAGLQGRIRLTVRESHWTARPYRSIRVSVLDWGLLPRIGRQSYEEERQKFRGDLHEYMGPFEAFSGPCGTPVGSAAAQGVAG